MLAVALTGRVSTAAAAFGVSRTRASVTVEGPGGAERASTMRLHGGWSAPGWRHLRLPLGPWVDTNSWVIDLLDSCSKPW